MIKYKRSQRFIAIFFLIIFFPTLVPNNLYASNNGPLAPEAASFEPVDSSDMVNLVTGDMSYVLPLINVPSPEGGYPLALSYHSGIALGQESSWVGLGWNLNPGAINRSVNNTPDDWNNGKSLEFVYSDLGSHDIISVGLGVQYEIFNAGLDYTFVDGKGSGGIVSFGVGYGGYGVSEQIGFGANSDDSSAAFSIGGLSVTGDKNGMSVGLHTYNTGPVTMGVKMSSQGVSMNGSGILNISGGAFSASFAGFGVGFSNGNRTNAHGVRITTDSFSASIPLPPYLSLRFGHSRVHYSMFDAQTSNINGVLYSKDSYQNYDNTNDEEDYNYRNNFMDSKSLNLKLFPQSHDTINSISSQIPYMSYDNYSVSGQGIIQNIQPLLFESKTIALSGYNKQAKTKRDIQGAPTHYLSERHRFNIGNAKFENKFNEALNTPDLNKIHFYGLNSNTSYIDNSLTNWSYNSNNINYLTDISNTQTINTSIGGNVGFNATSNRLKKDSYIETYTNEQISNNPGLIIEGAGFNRSEVTAIIPKGIGAFKVTTVDGKTYHYSIPVYNYELFMRSYDVEKGQDKKFIEKINTQPFATHWLLTAITGPDYVDANVNGITDSDDYGYWVNFEYGKLTNNFVWKKETFNDKNIIERNFSGDLNCEKSPKPTNSWAIGVKQIYYLNAVNTRTHSALFVKSIKSDDYGTTFSKAKTYNDITNSIVYHSNLATGFYSNDVNYDYNVNMNGTISTLKLEKVVLIKSQDKHLFNITPQTTPQYPTTNSININSTGTMSNMLGQDLGTVNTIIYQRQWVGGVYYNNLYLSNNINSTLLNQKSLKQVVFDYDYSLSKIAGNGKLTLKSIKTLGRNNVNVLPPYKFEYNILRDYASQNYDLWGYDRNNPENYSLKNIQTPLGSVINIEYEKDDFSSTLNNKSLYPSYYTNNDQSIRPEVKNFERGGGGTSGTVKVEWHNPCYSIGQVYSCVSVGNQISITLNKGNNSFTTNASITSLSGDVIGLNFAQPVPAIFNSKEFSCCDNEAEYLFSQGDCAYSARLDFGSCVANDELIGKCRDSRGGIRVKNISTIQDGKKLLVSYNYCKPNTSVSSGVTASSPYTKNDFESFFPGGVMYEHVTVSFGNEAGGVTERYQYRFNVLKPDINYTFSRFSNDNGVINTNPGPNALNVDGDAFLTFGEFLKISVNEKIRRLDVLSDPDPLSKVSIASSSILDNTSKIGNLISIKKINPNGHVLNEQLINYGPSFIDDFGTYSESFKTFRTNKVFASNPYRDYYVNSSKVKVFPSKTINKIVKDDSHSKIETYDKYDFLTGQLLEITSTSSDGKSFKTKIVPAYLKYPQMGSKVDNINNRNMLSQTAAEYTYIMDEGSWKETGVGITTWNNEWTYSDIEGNQHSPIADKEKIWRKHKSYTWNGDKDVDGIFLSYNGSNDDGFDWSGVGVQPSQWKMISEVTLYDHYSMTLEAKDTNGNKASTKMGDSETKIITLGNAAYNEMYYTSGEYLKNGYLEPGVRLVNAYVETSLYHTGEKSVAVTSNGQLGVLMRSGQHKPGKYKLSIWIHKANASKAKLRVSDNSNLLSFSTNEDIEAGDWVLKTAYIDVPNGDYYLFLNSIDATPVFYDDLMIRPVNSSITGYVYDELDQLSYIVNNNGLATRFVYDAGGRLVETHVEVFDDASSGLVGGFKLKSKHKIKYKNL